MSDPKPSRNARIVQARRRGMTISAISRSFHVSRTRVKQILERSEFDDLARRREAELEGELERVTARIHADMRRRRVILEELRARATDRILGL